MKTNVPIKKQRVEAKAKTADTQRRINGGWLRLWQTVYPNVPPPAEIRSPKCEPRGAKGEVRAAETVPQQGEGSRFRVQGSRFKVQPEKCSSQMELSEIPRKSANCFIGLLTKSSILRRSNRRAAGFQFCSPPPEAVFLIMKRSAGDSG